MAEFTRVETVLPGTGEVPPLHARCLVHYTGKLVSTGEIFQDTRAEASGKPSVVIAGRRSSGREVGLNMAVGSMRVGERSIFRVPWEFGFGEKGSFSFPAIPPKADLLYEVELLGFDPAVEGKETHMMTFEERVDCAERRKTDGNVQFANSQWDQAITIYHSGLDYVPEDLLLQVEGPHYDAVAALRNALFVNLAACYLKKEDWQAAIESCSEILARDPKHKKALFRRAVARRHLSQTAAARADLEAADAADPAVQRELQLLRAEEKRLREAEAKVFKGAFAKAARDADPSMDPDAPPAATTTATANGATQPQQRRPPPPPPAVRDPFSEIEPAPGPSRRNRSAAKAQAATSTDTGVFWAVVSWFWLILRTLFGPFLPSRMAVGAMGSEAAVGAFPDVNGVGKGSARAEAGAGAAAQRRTP